MSFKCAQDYSLSALHHTVPPPWGSRLSLPPKANKQTNKQIRTRSNTEGCTTQKDGAERNTEDQNTRYFPLITCRRGIIQGSKTPKSGSGESEWSLAVSFVVLAGWSKHSFWVWPKPVAFRKRR